MIDQRSVVLNDLCVLIVDSEHKTAPKDLEGLHPLIRTTDLGVGRADYVGAQRVNTATHAAWTRRAVPSAGDLILAREAPVGGICCVPANVHPVLGQRTVLLRPDPDVVHGRFLMYRLAAPDMQGRMNEMSTGSTVPHLNMSDIRAFRIPSLPPLRIQRRIAAVLAAIDELVEINERRIELLAASARSLYSEWFVRLRFPGHIDEPLTLSELGPIPEGWAVQDLFDVAEVGFGYSFKSERFANNGPYPVIRIRDVLQGATATYTDEPVTSRYAVDDGDILVGMDGEFHLNEWSGGKAWLNQRVARMRPRGPLTTRHLALAVAAPIRAWNDSISGTTVAHLGKRHLAAIRLIVPSGAALDVASAVFAAVADEELAVRRHVRALHTTRDLLLPRLVTGRLDISDIDLGDLLPADAA